MQTHNLEKNSSQCKGLVCWKLSLVNNLQTHAPFYMSITRAVCWGFYVGEKFNCANPSLSFQSLCWVSFSVCGLYDVCMCVSIDLSVWLLCVYVYMYIWEWCMCLYETHTLIMVLNNEDLGGILHCSIMITNYNTDYGFLWCKFISSNYGANQVLCSLCCYFLSPRPRPAHIAFYSQEKMSGTRLFRLILCWPLNARCYCKAHFVTASKADSNTKAVWSWSPACGPEDSLCRWHPKGVPMWRHLLLQHGPE